MTTWPRSRALLRLTAQLEAARAADHSRAEQWLQKMRMAGLQPNVVTYGSAIHACAQAGEVERAEACLGEMLKDGPPNELPRCRSGGRAVNVVRRARASSDTL